MCCKQKSVFNKNQIKQSNLQQAEKRWRSNLKIIFSIKYECLSLFLTVFFFNLFIFLFIGFSYIILYIFAQVFVHYLIAHQKYLMCVSTKKETAFYQNIFPVKQTKHLLLFSHHYVILALYIHCSVLIKKKNPHYVDKNLTQVELCCHCHLHYKATFNLCNSI